MTVLKWLLYAVGLYAVGYVVGYIGGHVWRRLFPLLLAAVLLGGCAHTENVRPFADVRLLDHVTHDQRSSVDVGLSIAGPRSVVDVGLALDFDLGGSTGPVLGAGRTIAGVRVAWRAR